MKTGLWLLSRTLAALVTARQIDAMLSRTASSRHGMSLTSR